MATPNVETPAAPAAVQPAVQVDVIAERKRALDSERDRVRTITEAGKRYNAAAEAEKARAKAEAAAEVAATAKAAEAKPAPAKPAATATGA